MQVGTTIDVNELKNKCFELFGKKHKDLLTYADKLLEITSDNELVKKCKFWRGYALILNGEYERAETELKKLIEIYSDDVTYVIDIINSIAWMGNMTGILESINENGTKALELSVRNKYLKGEADACNHLGSFHENKGNYSIGLNYHFRALNIRKEYDKKAVSGSLGNIGNIYFAQGNLAESLKYHLESFALDKMYDNKRGMSISLNNIGNVYEETGNAEEAIKHFMDGIDLSLEVGNEHGLGILYLNLANLYSSQKNFDGALLYHQKSLDIKERIGDYYGIIWSLFSLAELYIELGDCNLAKEYVLRGMEVNKKVEGIEFEIWHYALLGKIKEKQNQLPEAILFFKEACIKAEEKGRKVEAKVNLELLYKAFEKINDPENAFQYFKLYHQLEKEILSEETTRYIASVKYTAEIEQKKVEAEMERLRNVELKNAYENLERSHLELKEAQEELLRKERMVVVARLASEIAHEVQNPLNFVNNFSELNSELVNELINEINQVELSDNVRELIEHLRKNSESISFNGRRASGIVSQLLELTRKGISK